MKYSKPTAASQRLAGLLVKPSREICDCIKDSDLPVCDFC